jgi:hypothetical protein
MTRTALAVRSPLLALLALVLSGCLNIDLTTAVSPEGAFTGEYRTSFHKAQLQEFGVHNLKQAEKEIGSGHPTDKVKVAWSETADEFVQTVTFTDASAAEIEAAMQSEITGDVAPSASPRDVGGDLTTSVTVSFPLTARVSDNQMVVTLAREATAAAESATAAPSGGPSGSPGADNDQKRMTALIEEVFADATIDVAIAMPGPVSAVTGSLPEAAATDSAITVEQPDANSVRMHAGFLDLMNVSRADKDVDGLIVTSAVSGASASGLTTSPPPLAPIPSANSGLNPRFLLGGLALLVAMGLAIAIIARRGRNTSGGSDGEPPSEV